MIYGSDRSDERAVKNAQKSVEGAYMRFEQRNRNAAPPSLPPGPPCGVPRAPIRAASAPWTRPREDGTHAIH